MYYDRMRQAVIAGVMCLFMISGNLSAQHTPIELKFAQPPGSESDVTRTLQSLVKVRGTGGLYQDGIYLMTHSGDREELFQAENQKAIDEPMVNQTWRYCSIFSATSENTTIMGRNWDNQNVGSIIVSLYHPANGYSSVSFSRAIDMGFPLNLDLENLKTGDLGNRLLLAPFYAMDGINVHGVAVAVAGVGQIEHSPKEGKEPIFVTYLVRKILDQTKNIDEAVHLADKYIPFDLDENTLNVHFYIVDSSGASVILEYDQDGWRKIFGDKSWQVLTNKPVYNVPDEDLREQCRRYRTMSEFLEKVNGDVGWRAGMNILRNVQQKGTTWSVVYSPRRKDLNFIAYQKWDTPYHIQLPK